MSLYFLFIFYIFFRMNCVHVDDVVRAIWVAATSLREGSVYNLSDSSALGISYYFSGKSP